MQPVIAVTLGSNGFHLFDMRLEGQALQTTRHLYDNVQAESFVEKDGNISAEGMRVIAASLAKFSNYIQSNPGRVCGAIATGTFRRARNAEDVMTLAGNALGMEINRLSGQEEGLLCYMGIASSLGFVSHSRLVIDVGGGSTELMIVNQNQLIRFASLDVGCVSLTRRFFSTETLEDEHFSGATRQVREIVNAVAPGFLSQGWEEVLGCGGSVSSLFSVLQRNRMGGRSITLAGLGRFREAVVESGNPDNISLVAVPRERSRLLPAGASILDGIYQCLDVERMTPAFTSVGQGLIVSLFQKQSASV